MKREFETVTVTDLSEFAKEVVPRLGPNRQPIYRGQESVDWALRPGLYREDLNMSGFDEWPEIEADLIQKLKTRGETDLGYRPETELEWMAAAQHIGMPTRLTAWTPNPLVGLYFAIRATASVSGDAVVWRMMPEEDADLVIAHDHENVPTQPKVFFPKLPTEEMRAQRVCFVSHPLPSGPDKQAASLETVYERGVGRIHLCQIVIPEGAKMALRRELAAHGVDAYTVSPTAAGRAQQIRDEIGMVTDRYDWVFDQ